MLKSINEEQRAVKKLISAKLNSLNNATVGTANGPYNSAGLNKLARPIIN